MRLSCDPVTRPELCKSVCEVWDGSKWTSQQSVSIVTAKQRREEDKKAGKYVISLDFNKTKVTNGKYRLKLKKPLVEELA